MRLDREHIKMHAVIGGPICLATGCLALWYLVGSWRAGAWLRGGALPALACGGLATLFVILDVLLGLRKRLRAWRMLPARYWMAAHLWSGLATLPLAFMHSGFHFGGRLPSILLLVLVIVFLSGVYGWIMQHIIPSLMLKQVPTETVLSEIDAVSRRNVADLRLLITQAYGPSVQTGTAQSPPIAGDAERSTWDGMLATDQPSVILIGARRDQAVLKQSAVGVEVSRQDAPRIWFAFDDLSTYLLHGKKSGSRMLDSKFTEHYFRKLILACDETAAPLIQKMEAYCDERRNFDLQRRLNNWMVGWVPVHIGLAMVLCWLLAVHVVTALRYW